MPDQFQPAFIGEGIKTYKPKAVNFHASIHALYGSRPAFMSLGIPSAIVTMAKKYPDVSLYQKVIDWDKMRMKTDTVIIREGQNEWTDEYFARNWAAAKSRGMLRSAYRFYDGRISPGKQAENMVRNLEKDLPEMEVVMDWERSYGGAYEGLANVVTCMQRIEQLLPIKMMFYTGYYWFVDHSNPLTHASQYAYLKTIPLWLAWYTSNPAIVLIPKPWNDLWLWQYGTPSSGAEYGVQTVEIDMNWYNGTEDDFYYRYGMADKPVQSQPFAGVTHIEGIKNAWKYFVQIVDPAKASYEVYNSPSRETVSSVAKRKGAKIATNGGEWIRDTGAIAYYPLAPKLITSVLNKVSIDHQEIYNKPYISGLRYLIRNGIIESSLSGTEPKYTEGHSRTIEGITADGKHIQMVSEGKYPNQGLTLRQAAEVMKQYGAVVAFDSGGGGDSTLYMNGTVLNKTEDISNDINAERAIPQILLIYPQENNMANGTAKEALGKTPSVRNKADIGGAKVYSFLPNQTIEFVEIVNGSVIATDKWLKLPDGNFVNYIVGGVTYFTVLTQPSVPPVPSTPSVFISHEFNDTLTIDGKVYTATFSVPNVEYKPKP